MTFDQLKPNKILRGPLFAEPVEVIVTVPMAAAVKLVGRGVQTGKVVDIILTEEKLKLLETTPDTKPFDGDSKMFRLGIEAMRLALAFEYHPYFSLSIARVDPLPHQGKYSRLFSILAFSHRPLAGLAGQGTGLCPGTPPAGLHLIQHIKAEFLQNSALVSSSQAPVLLVPDNAYPQ